MSKIYPISRRQPDKYDGERGAYRNTYRGFAKCILTDQEVDLMHFVLTSISEADGVGDGFDEELDWLMAAINSGGERMDKLHAALGAFDIDLDNNMTKPDSEKIRAS